jgi:two-component system chemotaxis response regulator CheB
MKSPFHLIVVGASAGGMPALCRFVEQLPTPLPAAVLIVQHFSPDSWGWHLVERLSRHTSLPCRLPEHGDKIEPGTIYLAHPDCHLMVKDGHMLVTKGPHENHYRPAADSLFRSAAAYYGTAVIGVVLTGMLHDGTAGLELIKRAGGIAIVQDPNEAEFSSMPESALSNVAIDYVLPISQMGDLLNRLVQIPITGNGKVPEDIKLEAAIAERVVGTIDQVLHLGKPSSMTCPDCGGALFELKHGKLLRFRCHTGHAFTADALLKSTQHSLEETLWVALRMMEERKNLLTSMAIRGAGAYTVQHEERIEEIKGHINRLREFLLNSVNNGDTTNNTVVPSPEEEQS